MTKQGFIVSVRSTDEFDTQLSSTQPLQSETSEYAFAQAITYGTDVSNSWLLPDGVVDLLSLEAQKQEILRYQLTQILVSHGYELICPPMIEYTESLLNNASEDLKRQTFKIIDQLSGRLMGVRADITPQILRIDAHHGGTGIARYCYAGHVIRTLPKGLFGSRTPLQLGAEIFGCADIRADIELVDVLFTLLTSLDIEATLHVDIGHVAIFRRLCELAQINDAQAKRLMSLYANKALPELKQVCSRLPMGDDFYQLASVGNDMVKLNEALSNTAKQDAQIHHAITQIQKLTQHLQQIWHCDVSTDMTELSGYHYHTGLVFNVYMNNKSRAVASGGRFEGMSRQKQIQGKSIRPATGFSLDVTRLQQYISITLQPLVVVDYMDSQQLSDDHLQVLEHKIANLRAEGYRVIQPLTADDKPSDASHYLRFIDGQWELQAI